MCSICFLKELIYNFLKQIKIGKIKPDIKTIKYSEKGLRDTEDELSVNTGLKSLKVFYFYFGVYIFENRESPPGSKFNKLLIISLQTERTVRLRKIAPFLLFVILSGAKDLHFKPTETLRFAQSDSYYAVCRPSGFPGLRYL